MDQIISDIHQGTPPTIGHVIGQKRVVRQLRVAFEALYNDRAAAPQGQSLALPHILLVGPPGVGKSMLAAVIAREVGGEYHEELAQNICVSEQLYGLLMLAEAGDCIFLDEIHELGSFAQTALYRALEERRLHLPESNGGRRAVELPPFTFIAATTDEHSLTKPLRDRFKIVGRLEHYSDDELESVVTQRARRLGWDISKDSIRGIASRAKGTPRLAMRLLESTRRTARSQGATTIDEDHFKETCEIESIDDLGLDVLEQRYLAILRQTQGPVRLNMFASGLGLPRQTIEHVIEPDLIRLNLICKSDDGRRMLTDRGRQHLLQR